MTDPLPVDQRPRLDRASLDAVVDMTRNPDLDVSTWERRTDLPCDFLFLHHGTFRGDGTLIYRARQWDGGDSDLRVFVGATATPHGPLACVVVSTPHRYPTWDEMKTVRYTFMDPEIDVMMMLPGSTVPYLNAHPYALWLWETPRSWGWPPVDPATMAADMGLTVVNEENRR